MARRTTDTFVHVNAVIEVGVVRQVVHANPLDWFACSKTRAHRFEIWAIGPDLFVATHARVGWRHTRGRGCLNRRVTVATIDSVVADVMFVTELDWLLSFDPLPGVPRRTIQLNSDPQQSDTDKKGAVDRDFSQRVRTVMEDLGHACRIREGTSHRYSLGDTTAHKPFTFRTVYCKVLVLYQIDRNFQIASHLHVESGVFVRGY